MPIWSPGRHIPTQKIPKCPPPPPGYKVTSIGDKFQRRETAATNNKNNKDISIFFVTQHQLSIIVKHKQKKSFIKKWRNIYTKTPPSSLQWILKELSKCLKRFYTPVDMRLRSYSMLFHDICWPVYFKFASRGCDRKPP